MDTDRSLQLAWAAGFVDGEAFVGMNRQHGENGRDYFTTILDVSQNHAKPLARLVELFGGSVKVRRVHKGVGAGTSHYFWRLHGEKAIRALVELLPYLIVKDRQARVLVDFQATMAGYGKRRRITADAYVYRCGLYALLVELNSRPPSDAERLSEAAPLTLVVNG
jgi:hypothetical protein